MLPSELIVPALQRVEDTLESLDSAAWELDQIAGNPELPWHLIPEAERKVTQAKNILNQVLPLLQEMMAPFTEEQATLKVAQEAVLQASHNACLEKTGPGVHCLLDR